MVKESEIQRTICDYLALKKYFFWRNNNTPIFDPVGNKFRAMPKYTMRGRPDIEIIKDGEYIALEVKRPKAKMSDFQKIFEEKCLENGGRYYVVHSLDEVATLL